MDPKIAYKIKYLQMKINEMMEFISNAKDSLVPPEMLEIDFKMKEKTEVHTIEGINSSQFYELLL